MRILVLSTCGWQFWDYKMLTDKNKQRRPTTLEDRNTDQPTHLLTFPQIFRTSISHPKAWCVQMREKAKGASERTKANQSKPRDQYVPSCAWYAFILRALRGAEVSW